MAQCAELGDEGELGEFASGIELLANLQRATRGIPMAIQSFIANTAQCPCSIQQAIDQGKLEPIDPTLTPPRKPRWQCHMMDERLRHVGC